MKKLILLGIVLGIALASLGGCFIPYYDGGGGHHGHGDRDRDRDRDDRYDHGR